MNLVGKKNVYICDKCGYDFCTVDLHEGTTPFMTGCRNHIIKCDGNAVSEFYRVDQDLIPRYEWYKPDQVELLSYRDKPHILQHVAMGGLLLREIKYVVH